MSRLDIGAKVVHPTLATLLHLFYDKALQLTIRQRLPRFENGIVATKLRYLLYYIVTQLVATRQEILNRTHDALLLVHLGTGTTIIRLLIGIVENFADDIVA